MKNQENYYSQNIGKDPYNPGPGHPAGFFNRPALAPIRDGLIRIIVYAVLIVGLAEFIKWDASQFSGDMKFSEQSNTEWLQSIFLAISCSVLLYLFLSKSPLRYTALLMLGLTGAAFFREQDVYFENYIGNGTWQVPVYLLLAVVLFIVVKNIAEFAKELKLYTQSTSFGVFLSGLLTTFVFSRLYGRKTFWYAVMGDDYMRAVKNAGEECLELYGYLLILISVIELLLMGRMLKKINLTRSFMEIRELLGRPRAVVQQD